MATMYCALCRRPVEAKRRIGAGTIVLAVLTAGVSLLALPFYRRRCPICESAAVSMTFADAELMGGEVANYSYLASLRARLAGTGLHTRLEEMEQRLRLTEGELEDATAELERLRTEREFDRQLLGDAAARDRDRRGE